MDLEFVRYKDEVEEILYALARERAVNVNEKPNFFQILYAFQFQIGQYSKAASTMYEYATRLPFATQSNGNLKVLEGQPAIDLLECRSRGLLAAHNALLLTDRQWIALYCKGTAPTDNEVQIIGPIELQQQYILTSAHLKLCTKSPTHKISAALFEPQTTLMNLLHEGFYDMAFSLVFEYGFDASPIFERLTREALRNDCKNRMDITESTNEIELPPGFSSWIPDLPPQSEMHFSKSIASTIWQSIILYLSKAETAETNFKYHICVAEEILRTDPRIPLPAWLVNSMKGYGLPKFTDSEWNTPNLNWNVSEKEWQFDDSVVLPSNPVALLRIYLKYNILDQALEIALFLLEIPKRVVGNRVEHYVPHHLLDQLSEQIHELTKDQRYLKYRVQLQDYKDSITKAHEQYLHELVVNSE